MFLCRSKKNISDFYLKKNAFNIWSYDTVSNHGPVVLSTVSLTNLLLTNWLTAVAITSTMQKLLTFFQQKKTKNNVFAIFQDRNFNVT